MARAPSTEGDSPIHGDAAGSPAGLYGIALKTCSAELERLVSAVAAVGEPSRLARLRETEARRVSVRGKPGGPRGA